MNNNAVKAISMAGSQRKREFFNLSCDNTSSFGFGEVQPTYVHPMLADSKMVMDSESLIRLAPMNVPTFGRLSLKTYSQFVPMVDIFPCINELLAKTRFTYGNSTYVPTRVPCAPLGWLSMMCLAGADIQIWVRTSQGTGSGQWLLPTVSKWNSDYEAAFKSVFGTTYYKSVHNFSSSWISNLTAPAVPAKILAGDRVIGISGIYLTDFVPIAGTNVNRLFLDANDTAPRVEISTCDVVINHTVTYNNNTYTFGIACNLSGFGKRIRKFLIGSGYQISLNSTRSVSLLPLFASYKAYFDLFNLPQWSNYEDTYLKKLVSNLITANLSTDICYSSTNWNAFTLFMGDVGSCWYTAPQEFISAHQQNVKNSPDSFGVSSFLSVGQNTSLNSPTSPNVTTHNVGETDTFKDPDARINNTVHGQLDSELLKRLYKWCNRNSVIGKRVADLLRAQGFQDYVDTCKSNYIGSFDIPIRINDVVSQADTFTSGTDGKLLGEYGGRGIGYNETKKPLVYETKELGFWVTLAVVVPDSGYGQAIDPSILVNVKEDFYNPEFDGLGMELSPKLLVCAQEDYTVPSGELSTQGSLDDSFGFVPRYSRHKVINNKLNGDISLRSMRSYYPPYTLDKLIYLNEIEAGSGAVSSGVGFVRNYNVNNFGPAQLPIAGNVWRYPTRYGWLGNLHRIFADVGVNDKNPTYFNYGIFAEVSNPSNDNFITQTVFNVRYYAPMLKIEDSYETNEEGNEGNATMTVSKA